MMNPGGAGETLFAEAGDRGGHNGDPQLLPDLVIMPGAQVGPADNEQGIGDELRAYFFSLALISVGPRCESSSSRR